MHSKGSIYGGTMNEESVMHDDLPVLLSKEAEYHILSAKRKNVEILILYSFFDDVKDRSYDYHHYAIHRQKQQKY